MGLCGSAVENKYCKINSTNKMHTITATRVHSPKKFYKSLAIIGKGTYSSVYLVENKKTGIKRAMKEIRKSALRENAAETIQNEIFILCELVNLNQDHPNIVKIYEIFDSQSFFYIISEYLEGGELFQLLTVEKQMSEQSVKKYAYDILNGINYCHKNGIVHRDLKPENLVFDRKGPDGTLKIIDFGTSENISRSKNLIKPALGTVFSNLDLLYVS